MKEVDEEALARTFEALAKSERVKAAALLEEASKYPGTQTAERLTAHAKTATEASESYQTAADAAYRRAANKGN